MKNATVKTATPGSLRAVKTISREDLADLSLSEIEMLFDAHLEKCELLTRIERKLSEYNEKYKYREHFEIGDLRWFDAVFNVYAEAKELFSIAGAYSWANDLQEMFHLMLFGDTDIVDRTGEVDEHGEHKEIVIKSRSIKEMHWAVNILCNALGEIQSEVDRTDFFLRSSKINDAA